jgi:hypothetical protein
MKASLSITACHTLTQVLAYMQNFVGFQVQRRAVTKMSDINVPFKPSYFKAELFEDVL